MLCSSCGLVFSHGFLCIIACLPLSGSEVADRQEGVSNLRASALQAQDRDAFVRQWQRTSSPQAGIYHTQGPAEAGRILQEAMAAEPTKSNTVGGGGLLDLIRPKRLSTKEFATALSIPKSTLSENALQHVSRWQQVTESPAVVNTLTSAKTFPFYMPPEEHQRLVVVDTMLPSNAYHQPQHLYPWSWSRLQDIESEEVGEIDVPGMGKRYYLEVWPERTEACAPPGCPLVVWLAGLFDNALGEKLGIPPDGLKCQGYRGNNVLGNNALCKLITVTPVQLPLLAAV